MEINVNDPLFPAFANGKASMLAIFILYWCSGDEDLMGHVIDVAESSHPMTMARTAMVKWLVL